MLEGYITPLLMSYIDRYVKNIKPSDLKLSFWGGDAVLRNLELRLDVLERELGIPLEFKSGCIRELVLHLPWNAIGSSSVEVTIKDIEFVIKLKSLRSMSSSTLSSEKSSPDANASNVPVPPKPVPTTEEKEPAPGYLQGYLNRIINNVCVRVQNMVVKVIEEESNLMLTLNIGSIDFHTANENWKKEFIYTDYFQDQYSLYKLLVVRDVAINLHPIEMMEKGQGSLLHEPFVKRCELVCRMTLEYQGKVSTKRTFQVVIDDLEMAVDERQFCLFLHLSDWLLAMYYSFKKLKGRDENPYLSSEGQGRRQSASSTPRDLSVVEFSEGGADVGEMIEQRPRPGGSSGGLSDAGETGGVSQQQQQQQQQPQQDAGGWGSWLLSYIGPSGSEMDISESDSQLESEQLAAKQPPKKAKSRFSISANSVTVMLKMTQHVQVPVFVRMFTSPVLRVTFTKCLFRLDRCPVTTLFLMCIGIGTVKAEVMGLCPCAKKFPSSWRRTSVASTIDTSQLVSVFSLGSVDVDPSVPNTELSNSVDKVLESDVDNTSVTFVVASNKAAPNPSPIVQSSSHFPTRSSTSSKLGDEDFGSLGTLGESFQAVWFTYDYHDVGPQHSVEECTEVLRLGVVCAVFSPDVVHRLELFYVAFRDSLKITPSVSTGSVVIGDPKAITHFEIKLAGLRAALTPSSHYLPTLSTLPLKSQSFQISPKLPKKEKQNSSPSSLPCLFVTCVSADLDMFLPMYRRNALPNLPQKQQVRVSVHGLKAGTFDIRELSECVEKLFVGEEELKKRFGECDFLALPSADFTYNSVVHGCGSQAGDDDNSDTSHMMLCLLKASIKLSTQHVAKILFVSKCWMTVEPAPSSSQVEYTPPQSILPTRAPHSHFHLTLSGLLLSMSVNSQFVSRSLVLEAVRGSIVRGRGEEEPSFLPFLYGPFDTSKWNDIKEYGGTRLASKNKEEGCSTSGKLLELLVTTPHEKMKDMVFPTVKLSVSGFALHTHSALLQFLQHLSLQNILNSGAQFQPPGTSSVSVSVDPQGGGEGVGEEGTPTTPFPYTLTPTASVMDQSLGSEVTAGAGEENKILSVSKNFAVRVKFEPILVILSVSDTPYPTSCSDISSDLYDNFPILTQINATDHTATPSTAPPATPLTLTATVLSLPSLLLESAKSHVLDEPVPRQLKTDTLPWDCSLTDMAAFTICGTHVRNILEPVGLKMTLASQQEGIGVTIHSDTVALSVSKKQIHLLRDSVTQVLDHITMLTSPAVPPPVVPHRSRQDSGGGGSLSRSQSDWECTAPSLSNATPTLPTASSEVSTTLSSNLYQGLSCLWLQLIVSKCVLHIYGRDYSNNSTQVEGRGSNDLARPPIRVSLEVESTSLQLDVQEKCTDFIFKVSSVECSFCKLSTASPPLGPQFWVPCLENSNGKLFSSTSSNLPENVLRSTTPGLLVSQPLSHQPFSAKFQPVFLYLKGHLPSKSQVSKRPGVEVNVCAFEAVVWLPVWSVIKSIFSFGKSSNDGKPQQETKKPFGLDSLHLWPDVELTLESFRVILPNQDFSNSLLLNTEGVKVTSFVDFAGPEVRLVSNHSAYQRLSLLSSERRQPPLPVYQLDAYSLAVWGVGESGKRTFLYSSTANLQLTYTPPLYSTPCVPHPHVLTSPLILATGHCVEANFTNNFSLFLGQSQVSTISKVFEVNRIRTPDGHLTSEDSTSSSSTPSETAIPYKILLTGKTVAACLLPSPPETSVPDDRQYSYPGAVSPLFVCLLHNPLCTFQCERGRKAVEGSLFNVVLGYNREHSSLLCTDWSDEQNWPLSMSHTFQTRPGLGGQDKSAHPPDVLSLKWSRGVSEEGTVSGGVSSVAAVEVGRPCKLSCDPVVLRECLEAVSSLLNTGKNSSRSESHSSEMSEGSTKDQANGVPSKIAEKPPTPNTEMQLQVSTVQFLLELLPLSIASSVSTEGPKGSTCAGGSSHDLSTELCPPEIDKEGVLLAWNTLHIFLAHKGGTSATVTVGGAQLLSMCGDSTEYVVPPNELKLAWHKHLPTSPLDMSESSLSFTLGLLDFHLSQRVITLLHRVTQGVRDSLLVTSPPDEGEGPGRGGGGVSSVTRGELGPEGSTVFFKDDLRVLDFTYVVEECDCPRLPEAGEIVFHNGSTALVPSMTWKYWEPRAVTRLHVLPVPLSISHQQSAPITSSGLKVGCALEYWSDVTSSFTVLCKFFLSESTASEVVIGPEQLSVSRTWMLSVTHVQWFNEQSAELETILCKF